MNKVRTLSVLQNAELLSEILPEILDEEAFAAPDWLSTDDCIEQLGADWRWPSAGQDQDEAQ